MASLALGIIGGGIGFVLGGPFGAQLGFSLGVTLAGVIFPPKLDPQQRGRLDDIRLTGSSYGAVIPQVWGKARLGGNIIWASDLIEHKSKKTAGGKGAPQQEVTTYSYFTNLAVLVTRGPIEKVIKIWGEDIILYDDSKTPKTKYDITIYLGDETQVADPLIESFEGVGNVPAFRGSAYIVFSMLPLKKFGNRIPQFTFEISTGTETIQTVLTDIFEQAGIAPEEHDFTATVEPVTGFIMGARSAAAEIVDPMLRAFGIDLAEVDGKILSVPRGGAVELTILPADLGAGFYDSNGGNSDSGTVAVKRLHDFELPASVEITYFDVDKDYQTGSQLAIRYTKGHVEEKLTVTLPMVLTSTEARQRAEYMLYDQWISRESYTASLPPAYLKAIPTTPVMLPLPNGDTVRARILGIDMAVFGPLAISFVKDDTNILDQFVTGGDLGTNPGELDNPDTIVFLAFCCNALQDEDADTIGFYMGAAGETGWEGVATYRARSTTDYKKIKDGALGDSIVYGAALTALHAGVSTGIIDNTYTLDVRLTTGELETISTDELLAGGNACLLGDEVFQFTVATALSSTDYRLSGLRRGCRGTEYAWGTHIIGDRFVLLSDGAIQRVNLNRDLIGKTIHLKAITDAQALADVSPVDLVITGQELKPYAPVSITGVRDGSQNLTLTWQRRARKEAEWADLGDIDLDELLERYTVEIYNGVTLLRTITGLTTPTTTYSAADQTTDFGSPQSSIKVKVYQLGDFKKGSTTARMTGYPGTETV